MSSALNFSVPDLFLTALNLSRRPSDFKDLLNEYKDWNIATNTKSHYVLDFTRRLLCQRDIEDNGDYIYNYEQKIESRTFSAKPGKNIIHFQLAVECSEGTGSAQEMFRVYFNKFVVAEVNDPSKFISIKEPCKISWMNVYNTTNPDTEDDLDYYCVKKTWNKADY